MFGKKRARDVPPAAIDEGSSDQPHVGGAQLSGETRIKDWLAHPRGGPLLRAVLAEAGLAESRLDPVRNFALKRLIQMSDGRFSEAVIENLVAKARLSISASRDRADAVAEQGVPSAWTVPGVDPSAFAKDVIPGRFAGRTVIVTGAGSGIGGATASRIAREGGRVIAADMNEAALSELLAQHEGKDLVGVVSDITQPSDVAAIMEAAGERIDGLANVAGVVDNMAPLHEVSDDVWERVMEVNVTGTFKLTRAVLPAMIRARSGAIVNVASAAPLRGSVAGFAYTASAHALVGMAKSAALTYGAQGIRVNAIALGGVGTGVHGPFDSASGGARVSQAVAAMPERAAPESIAAPISFLLSDDGQNINGAVFPSDGGWSAA